MGGKGSWRLPSSARRVRPKLSTISSPSPTNSTARQPVRWTTTTNTATAVVVGGVPFVRRHSSALDRCGTVVVLLGDADGVVILECAVAAARPDAARDVLGFVQRAGLADRRITPLVTRLQEVTP